MYQIDASRINMIHPISAIDGLMVQIDLRLSAFYILEFLCALPADSLIMLPVQEIARRTHLNRLTVSRQLKWLALYNLIKLERRNHWILRIEITPEGRLALEKHHEFGQVSKL